MKLSNYQKDHLLIENIDEETAIKLLEAYEKVETSILSKYIQGGCSKPIEEGGILLVLNLRMIDKLFGGATNEEISRRN